MVFCVYCGNKLEEHWIVCPNCGASPKRIIESEQKAIIPQQETKTPQKISNETRFKRKKKKLAIICLIIGLVGGFFIGGISINIVYTDMTTNQRNEIDALQREYDDLLDDYDELLALFA